MTRETGILSEFRDGGLVVFLNAVAVFLVLSGAAGFLIPLSSDRVDPWNTYCRKVARWLRK